MKKQKVLLLLVILLIVGTVVGLKYFVDRNNYKVPTNNVAEQQGAEGVADSTKQSSPTDNTTAPNKGTNTTEPPASSGILPGVSLSKISFSQANGTASASATVSAQGTGTCYFNFSSSDTKPVSRTAQSQNQASVQICSVQIPEVEFTKLGAWQMLVSFTQNGAKVEETKNVTIN